MSPVICLTGYTIEGALFISVICLTACYTIEGALFISVICLAGYTSEGAPFISVICLTACYTIEGVLFISCHLSSWLHRTVKLDSSKHCIAHRPQKVSGLALHLICNRFLPFNCCLSVLLYLDKGDYSENSYVVFCPNK